MTAAYGLDDPRKGAVHLLAALRLLPAQVRRGLCVVFVGGGGQKTPIDDVDVVCTGLIRDARLLNLYFNAADVYVHTALADNFPNVLLESMASGTPCISFDVGGCGEIVREGDTGRLVPRGEEETLSRVMAAVLRGDDPCWQHMAKRCRDEALLKYGPEIQANRYIDVFSALL